MANQQQNGERVNGVARPMSNKGGPDFLGTVALSTEFVADLAKRIKSGQGSAIRIAMWKKSNQYGPFISLALETSDPYVPKQRGGSGYGGGGGKPQNQNQSGSFPWDENDTPF
jgi:hypothetical protein